MAQEIDKWSSPATGGELAEALLRTRLSIHAIYAMISALKAGNNKEYGEAEDRLLDLDKALQALVIKVGGLDAVDE